jgi:hypothetical protein
MITLQVKGLEQALAGVKNAPRQVQFATTVAINETAKIVQQHTITRLLPEKFTLRSRGSPWFRPGTRMGFNIRFAKQKDPEPTAIIGSRADWLSLQEEGGVKDRPTTIAIPTTFHKKREEILARNKRPKAIARLMRRKRRKGEAVALLGSAINTPFYLPGFTAGSGHEFSGGWWVRTSPEPLPIRPLFFFYETTTVPPVLEFVGTETKIASAALHRQFEIALRKALATARKK